MGPDVHWRVRFSLPKTGMQGRSQGSSSIGRVPVSKTGGWGFESLLPCEDERQDETAEAEVEGTGDTHY